jgi:hypothetical protein
MIRAQGEQPRWLHWLARKSAGKVYLMMVNDGDGEVPPSSRPSNGMYLHKSLHSKDLCVSWWKLEFLVPSVTSRCTTQVLAYTAKR